MKSLYLFFTFFLFFQNNKDASEFLKAEKLFNQGLYESSKLIFKKIVDKSPLNYKAQEYLGDIAGHQKKWDEALSYYQFLKTSDSKNAVYQYKYGGALGMKAKNSNKFKALSMISDIETSFLTAANLDKKFIDVRWALVELYLELPGIVGGSEKKANKYASELQMLSSVDGYLAKGRIEMYFKRYKKAEVHLIKAHEIGNSPTTFQKLYDLYKYHIKDLEKAEILKKKFLATKS